jgi:hypothetical protein
MKASLKDFKFNDLPGVLQLADYDKTMEKLMDHLVRNPDVKAVYTYGGMTHDKYYPGISDIDAIVVTEKLAHSRRRDFEKFPEHTALDKYLFLHGLAYSANEWALRDMKTYFFYPNAQIRHKYGKVIPITEPSGDQLILAIIATQLPALSFLIGRLSRYFLHRYLPVRQAIKTLSGERHVIAMMKILGFTSREWDQFSADVSALRQEWFQLKDDVRNEQILHLTERGLQIYKQFADSHNDFLSKRGFAKVLEECPQEMILELHWNRFVVFSDKAWQQQENPLTEYNWLSRWMPSKLKWPVRLSEWSVVVLPRVLAGYFYVQASFDTAFARSLRKRLFPSVMLTNAKQAPFYQEFEKQAKLFDHYWAYLQENELNNSCSVFLNQLIEEKFQYESWGQSARYFIRKRLSEFNRGVVLDQLQKDLFKRKGNVL